MRTTIRLDDQLLRDAKKFAAESGRTLTAVIEDSLRSMLARSNRQAKREHFELPVLSLGPPLPGVDLNSSAALLDLMEEDDAPI